MLGPQEPSAVNIHSMELIYTHLHTGAECRHMHPHKWRIDLQIYSHTRCSSFIGVLGDDLGALLSGCWQHIKNYNQ